jgi:uncharacterized HhH-GPD family protein
MSASPPTERLSLCFDAEGDALLARDPFALVVGMLLDQQMPMERAFLGPWRLADRLGTPERLSVAQIASYDPQSFVELVSQAPAVHRFPAAMAARIQGVAQHIVVEYAGDTGAIWRNVPNGMALFDRLHVMPGYGDQKVKILIALLGKQFGVQPKGWREACAPYGETGSTRSVADVINLDSLKAVRAFKQEAKLAARSK